LRKKAIDDSEIKINKSMTFEKWALQWLEVYKRPAVEDFTYKDYQSRLKNKINPVIGKMKLSDITPLHCQKVLNGMAGMSKDRIIKVNITMKAIFGRAVRDKLLRDNPALGLTIPKAEDGSRRSITDAERKTILKVADSHKGGLFIKFMLYCGIRTAEAAALQWRHIDLKTNKLKIDQALKKDNTIGKPKSKAGYRTIPIPDILADELRQIEIREPFDYVLKNENKERHSRNSIAGLWKNIKREMNIIMGCKVYRNEVFPPFWVAPDLVFYNLRHTYCTDLQAAGVPINIARELMGHSNIATTAKIYTHHSEDSFMSAAALINKRISEKGSKKAE
jgi:integrase